MSLNMHSNHKNNLWNECERLKFKLLFLYNRLFNIEEIKNDVALQWYSGALLLGFFITFYAWTNRIGTTVEGVQAGLNLCWPVFQGCQKYIWLSALPEGYSQTIVYSLLFVVILGSFYAIYEKKWSLVHLGILVLFFAKLYFMAVHKATGNFDYHHNMMCAAFLFFAHKRFFSQLSLVFLYFLSVASKIHPSWVLAQYFTTLKTGLPLVPFGFEIFMTNLLMIMEMIGAWFLFSKNRILQKSAFVFFVVFHFYSVILVRYHYPFVVLPAVLILFGPLFSPPKVPIDQKSIVGWLSMVGLLFLQLLPHMMPGDEKLTLEGNYYGVYMFDANHQCYGQFTDANGERVRKFWSTNARRRCNPYAYWFKAKTLYCKTEDSKYGFVMNHSINGNPFREIVNVDNICTLTYHPFKRNDWIKDETEAPFVGLPRQNGYGHYFLKRGN